jgi:hypothetical protein
MGEAGRAAFEERFTYAHFLERLDTMMRRRFPARSQA